MRLSIPAASKEYVRVQVSAYQDPTTATVDFAFPAVGASPSAWSAGAWEGAAEQVGEVFTATARILVGNGTGLAATAGTFRAFVRVNASPEAIVREFAQIAVT